MIDKCIKDSKVVDTMVVLLCETRERDISEERFLKGIFQWL